MSYTKIFAVPDPLGVHHFDDFDDALEFARAKGMSAGRILTEYLDEDGNPINAPQGEVDEDEIARQEALRIAQETIVEALRLSKAKAANPINVFTQTPEVTPQDLGAPSPVPYSLFCRQPSADLDASGQETRQLTISAKDLDRVAAVAVSFCDVPGLGQFIEAAFDEGAYRLEILIGDISIKVYKHPNN